MKLTGATVAFATVAFALLMREASAASGGDSDLAANAGILPRLVRRSSHDTFRRHIRHAEVLHGRRLQVEKEEQRRGIEAPNSFQGDNTPDNVAPGSWEEDAGCAGYYAAKEGDKCKAILSAHSEYGTSLDTFLLINPSLGEDCGNIVTGHAYCLGIATPANVADNTWTVKQGCTRYQTVHVGDYCLSIVSDNKPRTSIDLQQLYGANPSINAACTNLWIGESYCVGVSDEAVEGGDFPECPVKHKRNLTNSAT